MGSYTVIAPTSVVQAGRAWQVGDTVELDDDRAAALVEVGTLAPHGQQAQAAETGEAGSGSGESGADTDTESTSRRRRKTGSDDG